MGGTHHTFSSENTGTFYYNNSNFNTGNNLQVHCGGWRRSYEDGDITPTNEAIVALHEVMMMMIMILFTQNVNNSKSIYLCVNFRAAELFLVLAVWSGPDLLLKFRLPEIRLHIISKSLRIIYTT